mgnify:CR=1 FL=1
MVLSTILATATFVALLPNVFLAPFAGALIDRWNRRWVMIIADGSIALVTLVLVILFQPHGIYGIWLKTKHWFLAFPFKRKESGRRQKSYARSERLR